MFDRVALRFKQFMFAVSSRAHSEDTKFVSEYLTVNETALFERLPDDIRKHLIHIAKKLLSVSREAPPEMDVRLLVRVGLLHDIGKGIVHLSIADRVVMVILRRAMPSLYNSLADRGHNERAGRIARKFYVHREHAKIAADLLGAAGTEHKVIDIINRHSSKPAADDPIELVLLRKADEVQI
jgi:putative nucleotidyltransferase with HDIG domain